MQLYGVDPMYIGRAVQILCDEYGVAHIDLNFGCPVPKVTRKGGGAALPWKRNLLGAILRSAVHAATPYGVPVTMKTRIGIDIDHQTYLDAGRIAEDSGAAAIGLHGRTAAQAYSGQADWAKIAALVEHVNIPVLGNGDIWEAADALRMVARRVAPGSSSAAAASAGRGCSATSRSRSPAASAQPAHAGRGRRVMRRHGELLADLMGEARGLRDFRKHVPWYLKGFPAGGELRAALGMVESLAQLDELLAQLDPDRPVPRRRTRRSPRPPGQPPRPHRPPAGLAGRHRRPNRRPGRRRNRRLRRLNTQCTPSRRLT